MLRDAAAVTRGQRTACQPAASTAPWTARRPIAKIPSGRPAGRPREIAEMLAPLARGRSAVRAAPWPAAWLTVCALPALAALIVLATSSAVDGQLLLPLLAVPPALAGIGAATPRRPLAYGGVMLLIAIATAPFTTTPEVPAVTTVSILVVTLISAFGSARGGQETQRLADVTSVAEAAQRALLRPLPRQVGPLELGVVYLAAAAEARVGGDLYEVTRTQFGIRLIVGDVRGKGLDAVEIAADVLGVFREVAHEVYTLAEVARRIDASLARRPAAPLEEFVTAVLAEIDPAAGSLTIYNCGHPPPLVLSPGDHSPGDHRPGDRRPGDRRPGDHRPATTGRERAGATGRSRRGGCGSPPWTCPPRPCRCG